jgi:RNA-directed DNA polymerase
MAKDASMRATDGLEDQEAPVNTGEQSPGVPVVPGERVLEIQMKLHRWAGEDPGRQFDDVFNLVCDPAFLQIAWERVRGNRDARSAGVDGNTACDVEEVKGTDVFLAEVRASLKARTFTPLPVKERMIPKPGGKRRRLGIPTVTDRVVQAALKLVLEPIFETDFHASSYGFRPGRRAQDAIAEIHFLASHRYEWVLEGDIKACFDEIDHTALMALVRKRVSDKRVLGLIKAVLKAGILTQDRQLEGTDTGTPQGGILSPLLANIALTVLDEYVVGSGGARLNSAQRDTRRKRGAPNYRIVRYADDFVIMVHGTGEQTTQIRQQIAECLTQVGLRLSVEKTTVCHIDEGFDFLGWRIQRHRQKGSDRSYVYTYPARKSLVSVTAKVRSITRQGQNQELGELIDRLNPLLRGWSMYFRHGASSKTFAYLGAFTWWRVVRWIQRKHRRIGWRQVRRRFFPEWKITDGQAVLFDPATIPIVRYRFRGTKIPSPWEPAT